MTRGRRTRGLDGEEASIKLFLENTNITWHLLSFPPSRARCAQGCAEEARPPPRRRPRFGRRRAREEEEGEEGASAEDRPAAPRGAAVPRDDRVRRRVRARRRHEIARPGRLAHRGRGDARVHGHAARVPAPRHRDADAVAAVDVEHARVEDVLDALAAPVKRSLRLMKRQNYKSKERGVETCNELGEPGHDGNVIPVGKLADAAARGDVCVKERHGGQLLRDLANAQHPVSTPLRVPYLRCVCVNAPTKASPGSSPLPPSLPAVGEVVAKTFEDGKSYRGVVMRVVPEDEYQITVRYDDGDDETYRVADFDKECRPAKNPFATTRSIVKTEAACDGDSSIEFVEEIEVEENAKPLPAWDADANDDGAVTITLACYFGRLAFELIACDEIKFIMRHLTPSAPVRHRVAPPRTDAARRPTFVVDADAAGGSDDPGFCFTLPGLLAAAVTDGYAEAPQPRELALPLMDFQRQTVRWMMDQEAAPRGLNGVFWEERRFADADDDDDDGDDVDGVKTKTAADATRGVKRRGSYWYFPLAGELRLDEPPMSRGGMVCEEMGLGKTIEVLALIAHDLQANRGVKLESETLAAGRWAKQCKPKDALRKEADARGRAAYEEYMESVDEKIRRGEITIRDAVSEACEAQKSARAAIPDDRENGSVPSRATLVVVPPPLLRQ